MIAFSTSGCMRCPFLQEYDCHDSECWAWWKMTGEARIVSWDWKGDPAHPEWCPLRADGCTVRLDDPSVEGASGGPVKPITPALDPPTPALEVKAGAGNHLPTKGDIII